MKIVHKAAYIFIIIFFTGALFAQKADSLFLSDEIIEIELRSDFSSIQKERTGEPLTHEGELTYYLPGSKNVALKVKVSSRGFFRRDPSHCSFPPLSVNFKKNSVSNTLFEDQDKLKLVTPCRNDYDVIDEYLVYKLYNIITGQSLKVRLSRVRYFDTGKMKKLLTGYSFFIEHEDEAASRLLSAETKKFLTPFDIDRDAYIKLVLFQYMIGNKDWFVTSRKNIIIMQPSDSTLKPFAVPYDFDLSGFVNADYAKPAGIAPELLASKRVYKGICFSNEEFLRAFDYFENLRGMFTETIMNMKLLPKSKRDENIEFLNGFYRLIKDRKSAIEYFSRNCETRKLYNLPE